MLVSFTLYEVKALWPDGTLHVKQHVGRRADGCEHVKLLSVGSDSR